MNEGESRRNYSKQKDLGKMAKVEHRKLEQQKKVLSELLAAKPVRKNGQSRANSDPQTWA
ncbi:MAG: hypothetical protein NZ602_03655 [Thermoguttaceae bacterium]|nr:hypothetical protein [Thermoguttaceae bacterium]MDW8037832.1 hypothetical protein [Thermoguttaceae bacterium]